MIVTVDHDISRHAVPRARRIGVVNPRETIHADALWERQSTVSDGSRYSAIADHVTGETDQPTCRLRGKPFASW